MRIMKTLTSLVMSAAAVLALERGASADARAELSAGIGATINNLARDGSNWSEMYLLFNPDMKLQDHGSSWSYAAEADLNFQGLRGSPDKFRLRQVSMDVLLGHSYGDRDLKPSFLLGIVQSYGFANAEWLKSGFADFADFAAHSEAKLRGNFTALSLAHEWHKKGNVSERSYLVRADVGRGTAMEEAHRMRPQYPQLVILVPETEIRYLQASVGGKINLRNLLQRDLGEKYNIKFLGWEEYDMTLRLIGQSGGYSNLMIEGEIAYLWPLHQMFDFFGFGSITGTIKGVKPEDVRGNGNIRYDTRFGVGFRFSKSNTSTTRQKTEKDS